MKFCDNRANGMKVRTPDMRGQRTVYSYDGLIASGEVLLAMLGDLEEPSIQLRNVQKKITELRARANPAVYRGEQSQAMLLGNGSPIAALEDRGREPVAAASELSKDSKLEDSDQESAEQRHLGSC
jgi:hypothetical protein